MIDPNRDKILGDMAKSGVNNAITDRVDQSVADAVMDIWYDRGNMSWFEALGIYLVELSGRKVVEK